MHDDGVELAEGGEAEEYVDDIRGQVYNCWHNIYGSQK